MTVYRPQERRLVLRLMAYWDDLRGERQYPSAVDIDPAEVGEDWQHCLLIELAEPVEHSIFRHVGDALRPDAEGLPENLELRHCPPGTLLRHATHYLSRMLSKGVPMSIGGDWELESGHFLYRSILLPLSNDDARVDHVLGGANGRPVAGDGA